MKQQFSVKRMNKSKGAAGGYHFRDMWTQNRRMMENGMGGPTGGDNYLRNTQKHNNYGPARSYCPPVTQIPAKSTRLNDYCFDFGEKNYYPTDYGTTNKNYYSTEYGTTNRNHYPTDYGTTNRNYYPTDYGTTNGTSKYTPNQRSGKFSRGVARSTPYHVPVRNREQQRDYLTRGSREYGQQTTVTNEPKQDLRNVWKIDNRSKTVPKSVADISLKGISDFISPSPWYPGAKSLESSYQKNESENKVTSKYSTSDKPYSEEDINRNTIAGKWDTPKNEIDDAVDGANYTDDLYPDVIEEPVKNEWVVPPELNLSIASGVFYTKVCEAVLKKVLQQLCPNSYKANQRSGATSYNIQPQANPTFYSDKNVTDSSSRYPYTEAANFKRTEPFQYKASQKLRYNPYNRNYKKNAPKPLYNQSFRSVDTGRVTKRRILTKNQESLV